MQIEEIRGFVPVMNEDTGEEFMMPVVVGLKFTLPDAVSYGQETGEPTTFTYSFRSGKITQYPAQVAQTDKFSRPKRDFNSGKVIWQVVREEVFTLEEFLREFSYKFAEPILTAIAEGEEKRETLKGIRELKREVNAKKKAKRDREDNELATLLSELMA